nr:MAG TPA: hypothetical protein [Caudoviricetes sp.]
MLIEDTLRLTLWSVLVSHMIKQLKLVMGYLQERFLDSNTYKISLIIFCRNVQIRKLVYLIQKSLIRRIIRNCRCGKTLCKTLAILLIRKVILKMEKNCKQLLKYSHGTTGWQNRQIILQTLKNLIKNTKIL